MARTELRVGEKEKRNDRLFGAGETSAKLAEWRRLQQKKLSELNLPKSKKWSQCHEVSSWQGRQSCFFQKE